MIVGQDGYAINYEKGRNRITILLPPTAKTSRCTLDTVVERKTDLTAYDLQMILCMAEWVCEWREE